MKSSRFAVRGSRLRLLHALAIVAAIVAVVAETSKAQDPPAMQSWTDASLQAWWKAHPDPASWREGKSELLEVLRAAHLKYGTQRALENQHFLGWVGHLLWISAFPEGEPGDSFLGTEEGRKTFRDLSLKKTLPQLLASSLATEDDATKAVEMLCRIARKHPEKAHKFPELAVAIAVVFDQPFPKSWPHPFVKQESIPSGDLEVERRFEFYVNAYEARQLLHRLEDLSVKELTFVVDSLLKFDEFRYAQQWEIKKPENLAAIYRVIPGDMSRMNGTDYLWPHGTYHLDDIAKKGGICMDQAFYVSQTGKAKGMPTVMFIGQGRSGGHAWIGFLKDRGEWELDVARIRDENYPSGTMYDPQTWRRMTDSQFKFVMTDLMKTGNYKRAQQALQWASMNRDQPFYGEILRYARQYMSRYFVIWELEADWLEKKGAPAKEMEAFWKSWIANFRTETDTRIQGQVRLLQFYQKENDERAAERLKGEMLKENESKRFDLAITIAAESIMSRVARGDWESAEAEFNEAIDRFEKNAGGHLFYNLVEPYVERCLESGRNALAAKALALMKQDVEAIPNSLLANDIKKLEDLVAGLR